MSRSHKVLAGLAILVVVGAGAYYILHGQAKSQIGPEAKKIEGVGLRELNADTNVPYSPLSSRDKAMYQAILDVSKISGDGTDKTKNQQAADALTKVISTYPHASLAYFMRATMSLAAGTSDYQSVIADLNNALKYRSPDDVAAPSPQSIYGARAKTNFDLGDYQAALSDMETAVNVDPTDVGEAMNTGGTKPSDTSNSTVLNLSDYDALISKYPQDYRPYLYRGLFYNFFTTFDESNYPLAAADFRKAASINPSSPLPPFELGQLAEKATFLTKESASDISDLTGASGGFRDMMRQKALGYFNQAIAADPNFKYAYAGAAEALLELKKYSDAITDYNKVLELDPNDAGSYNDRGLANEDMGNYFSASSDFSDAIRLKQASSSSPTILGNGLIQTYQNRAGTYIKSQNYDLAADDYGKAIGLQLGSQVITMSLSQIRSIYPEFSQISDKDLIEGLRQKYDPNMSSADFSKTILANKAFNSSLLADLFSARADGYIQAGKYKLASLDYARAQQANPAYEANLLQLNRWKDVAKDTQTTYSIDALTLDFSKDNLVSFWFKATSPNGSYTQQNYQIDCSNKQIKSLSATSYDSLGNAGYSQGEQAWQSIAPQTIGETLLNGMCGS